MSSGLCVILAGNEGYSGILRPDGFGEAALTNFCARGGKKPEAQSLLSDLSALLCLSPDGRISLGRALREYAVTRNGSDYCARLTGEFYRENIMSRAGGDNGGVLICGYYGYGNIGDDSLLCAAVRRARERFPRKSVTALVSCPEISADYFGVRCVGRKNVFALVRELKRCDVLVFGGGSLIQDKTSLRSLAYYCCLLTLAGRMGKKTELWGNGIGPVRSKMGIKIASVALRGLHFAGMRDEASAELAKSLGVPADRISVEGDLAEKIPERDEARTCFLLGKYGLKGRKFFVAAPKGKAERGERKIFEKTVGSLAAQGYFPVFIPMFPREDEKTAEKLCEKFGGVTLRNLSGYDDAGILAHSMFAVGARLHLLIFAHAVGKKFIGIGSDPKIAAFCRKAGGNFIDCNTGRKSCKPGRFEFIYKP